MESLPHPIPPTAQEIEAENQLLRRLFFFVPPVLIWGFIVTALLIAICVAYNFNPMNWLE